MKLWMIYGITMVTAQVNEIKTSAGFCHICDVAVLDRYHINMLSSWALWTTKRATSSWFNVNDLQ